MVCICIRIHRYTNTYSVTCAHTCKLVELNLCTKIGLLQLKIKRTKLEKLTRNTTHARTQNYTHTHTRTRTHTHTHTYTYTLTQTYTPVRARAHTHIKPHTQRSTHTCTHACTHTTTHTYAPQPWKRYQRRRESRFFFRSRYLMLQPKKNNETTSATSGFFEFSWPMTAGTFARIFCVRVCV